MINREIDRSALSKAKPISDILQRPKCTERPIRSRLHWIHAPLLTIIIASAQRGIRDKVDNFLPVTITTFVVTQELHLGFIFPWWLTSLRIKLTDDHREDKVQCEDHLREMAIGRLRSILKSKTQLLALGSAAQ